MKLITYALLVVLLSCSKQEPESLESTHRREDITQNKDCENVVFLNHAVSKENLANLLSCMGWSKQYPALVKAIDSFNEEKFSYLAKPFNKSFFENRATRNTYFELFKILNQDNAEGFESLNSYIKELLPPWSVVAKKYFQYAQSEDRLEFLSKIKLNAQSVENEIKLYSSLQKYFLLDKKFSKKLAHALQDPELVELLSRVSKGLNEIDSNTKQLVAKVFWGQSGIVSAATSVKEKSFYNLTKFISQNYDSIKNIGVHLKKNYQKKFICPVDSKNQYSIQVHNYLKDEVLYFSSSDVSLWPSRLTEIANRIHLTEMVCPERKITALKSAALEAISSINQLCQTAGNCELFQAMLRELGPENLSQLYNYIASENFDIFHQFLTYFKSHHADLLVEFDTIINKVPSDFVQRFQTSFIIETENTSLSMLLLRLINSFNPKERIEGASLLARFVENEKYVKHVNPFFLEMFASFPELSVKYLELFQENPSLFYNSVLHFLDLVKDETVKEFTSFLSLDSLLKLYKQFSGKTLGAQALFAYFKNLEAPVKKQVSPAANSDYSECLKSLQTNYVTLSEYGFKYPKECHQTAFGFIHHFSQNFKIAGEKSNLKYFDSLYSPELLAQLVGISKKYKSYLDKNNLTSIDSTSNFLKTLKNENLGVFLDGLITSKNISYWHDKIKQKQYRSLRAKLSTIAKVRANLVKNVPIPTCKKRNKDVGAKTCLSNDELQKWLRKLREITTRKNQQGKSVISELLNMFYSNTGVPYQEPTKFIKIELKDFIAFFHQLSQKNTEEYLIYKYPIKDRAVPLTVLEQIEVLLRSISFDQNYFGAYFKNDIANTEDYVKGVKFNKRLFNNGGSWLLKLFGYIKDDYELDVKNASITFDSLIKLDEEYKVGKEVFRFGDITHSILVALVNSSAINSQDISIKNKPYPNATLGHNGYFLTHFANIGGLSLIGEYFKSRMPNLEKVFTSKEFKLINSQLFHKIPKEVLEKFLHNVLKHIDNKNLIKNFTLLASQENPEWVGRAENIINNFFYTLIASELESNEIGKLLEIAPSLISLLTKKEYSLSELKLAMDTADGFMHYLKENKSDAKLFLKLFALPNFPKDISFALDFINGFNSSQELFQFIDVILSGIDFDALDKMLKDLNDSSYIFERQDSYFQNLFLNPNFITNDHLAEYLESFLNDLNSHIIIEKIR